MLTLITRSPDMATSCRGGPGHTDLPLSDRTRLKLSGGVACFSLTARAKGMACRGASDNLQELLRMPKIFTTTHRHTRLFIIFYNDQQMHTIISQIITLLHVSTLSCHRQVACNQYLAKLHRYVKCSTNFVL